MDVEAPAFEPRRPRAKSPAGRASRGGERRINNAFAVGTALTGGPPHRSQRALLTHWAPTSGHDAQSLFGVRVQKRYNQKLWIAKLRKAAYPST